VSWRTTRATGATAEEVAVIDLGSNSWRLVVYAYAPGDWWRRVDELFETVRIGAGLEATGRLSDAAINRGLETLEIFGRFCRANHLDDHHVHTVATSAIRDATNRDALIRRASLPIEILSERDEAYYGYVAAVNSTTLSDGTVVELGGGSMQLVHVAGRRPRRCTSHQLGAVRMTEQFLPPNGPARKKDLARLRRHIANVLEQADWLKRSGERLVGIGGAVRNLAAAAQREAAQGDLGVQGYVITPKCLDQLIGMLAELPAAERARVPGIKPGRGDIILAAAVVLDTLLQTGDFNGLEATEASLRDGVFLARTLFAGAEPLFDDVRVAAVRNLAIQYESDLVHVEHVAALALQMHDSLVQAKLIRPAGGERELLWAAAMLHDVGMTISYDDHHKHSRYLIVSAELPGFDPRERALIAQITRYHRKGAPKLGELGVLAERGDEELLERCAILLRLAEHLERGRDQSVTAAELTPGAGDVALHLQAKGDLMLPRWSLERYEDGDAFRRVFGRELVVG
jgi:exopolyphosphatase/guanosine-5'-triphosphate,3'-diphosphate pyrophosphatase